MEPKTYTTINDGTEENKWKNATTPPPGQPGLWTKRVVVVTNYGNASTVSYFHGSDGSGVWQRPTNFAIGEEVAWWIEMPNQSK